MEEARKTLVVMKRLTMKIQRALATQKDPAEYTRANLKDMSIADLIMMPKKLISENLQLMIGY